MKKKTPELSDIFDAPPFLLHPENEAILYRGIRPKLKILKVSLVTPEIMLVVLLFVLMGFLFTPTIIGDLQTQQVLEQKGTETTAQIIGHSTQVGKSITYYITYRFGVTNQDGATSFYQKEVSVGDNTYFSHADYSPIEILYLDSNPDISMVGSKGDSSSSTSSILLLIFVLICYFGPVFALMTISIYMFFRDSRWKKATLLPGTVHHSDGYVAPGKVNQKGELIEIAHFNLIVTYEFRSPSGIQLFGENRAARDDHELPKPGTPVAVLYLNHEEFKML